MTTTQPTREMYIGETFQCWVIRRGWSFWTGTRFELAPYTARLYAHKEDAQLVIDGRGLNSPHEPATVRRVTLTHH
jgi:hypothetical protein